MKFLIFFFAVVALPAMAETAPKEIRAQFGSPVHLGRADVSLLGFDLYQAQLWSSRSTFSFQEPFALTLIYKRKFTAKQLTKNTIEEVARIENTSVKEHAALSKIQKCFADVGPNDRITGIANSSDNATFYVNGRQSCSIEYPKLTQRFFGIWLSENTRDPKSRKQLLGQSR